MLKRDFSGAYLTTEKSAANQKISDFLVKNSLTPPFKPTVSKHAFPVGAYLVLARGPGRTQGSPLRLINGN
jgi:hypothetical protein